jgi:hypothetical protein
MPTHLTPIDSAGRTVAVARAAPPVARVINFRPKRIAMNGTTVTEPFPYAQ